MHDLDRELQALGAHAGRVLGHGSFHFPGLDGLEGDGQAVKADEDDLVEHVLLLDDGQGGDGAGVKGDKDDVDVGVGGEGVLGQVGALVLIPVGPIADDLHAGGL